jgi:glutamine synthetase
MQALVSNMQQRGRVMAEYIWTGGNGPLDLRCKTKCLDSKPSKPEDLPNWNFDGSSTNQAPGDDSEVLLIPRAIFPDPLRQGDNILVVCDTYDPHSLKPLPTNTRAPAKEIMDRAASEKPWFGIEQEYTLFRDGVPLGWPTCRARSVGGCTTQIGYPGPQGPYYCSVGADVAFGRPLVEAHMKACLHAGVTISGVNGEVMPGQWEFQVGPCEGIDSGDHLLIARWLLLRLSEDFNIDVSFDPKPVPGDWNGAGCHTNFSTEAMRNDGGFDVIVAAVEKLAERHHEHCNAYGEGNERRLTGLHETSSMEHFSWGVANRGASVRIPNSTNDAKKGYLEDRRPSSNMDGYVVTSMLVETCCL